jgi:hypothetical protein
MAIELSDITFTEQDDVVPASGVEEIVNTGVANTFAGNDKIIGTGETLRAILFYSLYTVGIYNKSNGTINTDNGDDEITGYGNIGIYNESNGTINTGNGRDKITGYGSQTDSSALDHTGVFNDGIINTDSGDDTISGYATGDYPGGVVNSGSINTGNGDDNIIGDGLSGGVTNGAGGTINTGNGDDSIIGTSSQDWGIYNGGYTDENDFPIINTGNGDDSIIGTSSGINAIGIGVVYKGAINTNNGNDSIIGTGSVLGIICAEDGIIDTGDGNDILTGINGIALGSFSGSNSSKGTIKTGKGDDIITGIGRISNDTLCTIDTDADNDSIISEGNFTNKGNVFLGEGNDSITADTTYIFDRALENFGFIGTGDGNDIINSTGIIYNQGVIETGNGDDSIIVNGGVDDNGTRYGIYNNGGAINMGDGNDSITANEGFQSGSNSSGAWFLGEGDDYIKGFGSGDFYGGNGNDTLELTSGTYTVGIWGEGGESPIFTKGNQLMITSEFEKLKAGSIIYDFTSLTAGQIITVA